MHPDPDLKDDAAIAFEFLVQLGEAVLHVGRRAHGAEGVVFVDRRDPEYGHDGIADALLPFLHVARSPDSSHRSSLSEPVVETRVELFADRGRAGDVAEEDRTILRTSGGPRVSPVSAVAHSRQNFALSGFSSPHEGQTLMAQCRNCKGGDARTPRA